MKSTKLSKPLLIVFAITLNLTSCNSVGTPPDVPLITSINEHTGYYVYTMSTKEGYVNDTDKLFVDERFSKTPMTYSELKRRSLLIPSFSWEKINAYIAEVCLRNQKKCEEAGNPQNKVQRIDQLNNYFIQE